MKEEKRGGRDGRWKEKKEGEEGKKGEGRGYIEVAGHKLKSRDNSYLSNFQLPKSQTHSSCTWLTSLIDPCLDGGGPIFISTCLLPHTARMRTTVPTRRITNRTMAITMPAIAPPVRPAHGCHVTRHGSHVIVTWYSHRDVVECTNDKVGIM